MKIKSASTLLFVGDSITDCERSRPVGRRDGLGEGYVSFVDALLTANYPERRIRVLNTGICGNRVSDLEERWKIDVLDLAPDWLVVMIGVNDVWRQFDDELESGQVTVERFESIYRSLLEQVRDLSGGLVLMTPFFLEAKISDPMRSGIDAYGRVVETLAAEFDAVFVDVQAAFDRYLKERPTQSLCNDRVHPNKTGHMLIAKTFLASIGFEWMPEPQ